MRAILVLAAAGLLAGCLAPAAVEPAADAEVPPGLVALRGIHTPLPPVEGAVERPTIDTPIDRLRPPGSEDTQTFEIPEGTAFLEANLTSDPPGAVGIDFFDPEGNYVEDIWFGEEPGVELRVLGLSGTWTTVAITEGSGAASYRVELVAIS